MPKTKRTLKDYDVLQLMACYQDIIDYEKLPCKGDLSDPACLGTKCYRWAMCHQCDYYKKKIVGC